MRIFARKPTIYGVAGGICALAFVAGKFLGAPASSFMLAVMAASLLGGRRLAQLTVCLCICLFIFATPPPALLWSAHRSFFRIALFAIASLVTLGILEARTRAEEGQLQLGRDFRAVAETSPDCILFIDPGRRILFANPAVRTLFGVTQQQIVGQQITTLLPGLQERRDPHGEFSVSLQNGPSLTLEATCGQFGDKTTVFLRDISERKRAEESKRAVESSLRQTQAKLAQAAQIATASELAASIVHEISQPLSAIVINGQACLRWLQGESPKIVEGQAAAERIVRDGKEAGLIISGLRSMFSHVPLDKADLNMRDIANEVALLTHSKAQRAGIAVKIQMDEDLPAIHGDKVQLQQVLMNLILNAIEAMQESSSADKVITIRAAQEHEGLLISVEDQGVGAADYERIFDAFFSTKGRGMGMGLGISRSIVEAHQGRLWGSRGDPSGSVFSCLLPYARKADANEQRNDRVSA